MFINNLNLMLAFSISGMITLIATPFVKILAVRLKAMDIPNSKRHIHNKPIPRMGGLAIFYGTIISIACFVSMDNQIRGILIGSIIILALGILDDIFNLNALLKIFVQFLAAAVVILGGVKIDILTSPFEVNQYITLGLFSIPLTLIFIVGFTNAINFIDGLDGLAVGVSGIISLSLFLISLIVGEYNIAMITIIVSGACFGFLPFNFYPAKIFMGDTGSNFLGFILSCLSVIGPFKSYAVISFVVPVLILGLPMLEATVSITRRIYNKKAPTSADREHLHHHLIDLGLTQRQAVGIIYITSALLSMSAIILMLRGAISAVILILSVMFIVTLGSSYFVRVINDNQKN